jgi:membrane carboxypeptidase/penicillin-binding protein PbpC
VCDMHVAAWVDAEAREVHERCGGSPRVLERYPLEYREWAERAGRPLAGRALSPTCPPALEAASELRVTFPRPGQRFMLDPDGPNAQEIVLSATSNAARLRFIVDGQPRAEQAPPFSLPWRLQPGRHTLVVEARGVRSDTIEFEVASPVALDEREGE